MLGGRIREIVQDVRSITRNGWIKANGNPDEAKRIMEQDVRAKYGSVMGVLAIIILLIQFGVALINFWNLVNMSNPPDSPGPGEPEWDESQD